MAVLMLNVIMATVAIGGVLYSWFTGGVIRKAAEAVIVIQEISENVDEIHGWRSEVNATLIALAVTNEEVNETEVKQKLDTGVGSEKLLEDK